MAKLEDQLEEAREEARWLRDATLVHKRQFTSLRHLNLSHSEKTVLYALETAPESLSRESLRRRLDVVLQRTDESGLASVDMTILRLRQKLSTHKPPIEIRTERGIGFYMDEENKQRLRDTRKPTRTPGP